MKTHNSNNMKWWRKIDPAGLFLVIFILTIIGLVLLFVYLDKRNNEKYCDGEVFELITHELYNCCYEQKICRSNDHGGCYWDTEKVCSGRRFKE